MADFENPQLRPKKVESPTGRVRIEVSEHEEFSGSPANFWAIKTGNTFTPQYAPLTDFSPLPGWFLRAAGVVHAITSVSGQSMTCKGD